MKVKIIKKIQVFWLYFLCLFIQAVSAQMSNREKREFIESLVKPLSETIVLYRATSESQKEILLEAGEYTLELYTSFMDVPKREIDYSKRAREGLGLYAHESLVSVNGVWGSVIVQINMEKDTRYIDLTDEEIRRQIQEKDMDIRNVYDLDLRIAIRFDPADSGISRQLTPADPKNWILKGREGITFTPIDPRKLRLVSFEYMLGLTEQERKLFREDFIERVKKNFQLLETVYITEIDANIDMRKEDWGKIFNHHLKQDLSKEEKSALINVLSTRTLGYGNTTAGLNRRELIHPKYLPPIFEYLSEPSKNKILGILANNPSTLAKLRNPEQVEYLSFAEVQNIEEKIRHITSFEEGKNLLNKYDPYLREEGRAELLDNIRPYQSEQDLKRLPIDGFEHEETEQKTEAKMNSPGILSCLKIFGKSLSNLLNR